MLLPTLSLQQELKHSTVGAEACPSLGDVHPAPTEVCTLYLMNPA